jgi:hypothetical protein
MDFRAEERDGWPLLRLAYGGRDGSRNPCKGSVNHESYWRRWLFRAGRMELAAGYLNHGAQLT